MEQAFYRENRKRFGALMPEDAVAVFFSGEERRRTNDVFYEFEPDKNFLYLTGIDRERMALVITKKSGRVTETLFLPRIEEHREKWFGVQMRPGDATAISGIDALEEFQSLESFLFSLFSAPQSPAELRIPFGPTAPGEAPDWGRRMAGALKQAFPDIRVASATGLMTLLRYRKQPEEIEMIRQSARLLGQGLEKVQAMLAPGRYEYVHRCPVLWYCLRHR